MVVFRRIEYLYTIKFHVLSSKITSDSNSVLLCECVQKAYNIYGGEEFHENKGYYIRIKK